MMNSKEPVLGSTSVSRREFFATGLGFAADQILGQRGNKPQSRLADIRALVFDVYGSSTDYRGTIVREGALLNRAKHLQIDWGQFADDWRALCQPSFDAVVSGQTPWRSCTLIRREALNQLVARRNITAFTEGELVDLTLVWQRSEPWPDVLPGLQRLKQRYDLVALSNADMSTLINMAKLRKLPWDVIRSGELAKNFKPNAAVYDMVPTYLGVLPSEVLMVSCHNFDLRAARGRGFRTAFVARPLEYGPQGKADIAGESEYDTNVGSFDLLADHLQAVQ